MEKNFEAWHQLKESLQEQAELQGYKERDIWWTRIGHNIGFEEDGKGSNFERPVLIIRGFSKQLFWGVPLSTIRKTGKYYYQFNVNHRTNNALLSQMRAFDTKRLVNKMGTMDEEDFAVLKSRLRSLLS